MAAYAMKEKRESVGMTDGEQNSGNIRDSGDDWAGEAGKGQEKRP